MLREGHDSIQCVCGDLSFRFPLGAKSILSTIERGEELIFSNIPSMFDAKGTQAIVEKLLEVQYIEVAYQTAHLCIIIPK